MKKTIYIAAIGIMMLFNFRSTAQVDVTSHSWSSGFYVGWASNHGLDFKVGSSTPTTEMQLLTGGTGLTLNVPTSAYWINSDRVLWHNNQPTNIFVGVGAGANTTGDKNTFVGWSAGNANTAGVANTFIGYMAGIACTTLTSPSVVSGSYNTFTGYKAGESNTIGSANAFYGKKAGNANTIGGFNSFFGEHTGLLNTEGRYNSFFGGLCGEKNTEGDYNSFFGYECGQLNTIGTYNTFMGWGAGSDNTIGNLNTFYGTGAGAVNSTGDFNVFIGNNAGNPNADGSNNTCVGNEAYVGAGNLSNASAIGAHAIVTQSNSLILGSIEGIFSENTNVGIGVTAPTARLHVKNNAEFIGNLTLTENGQTGGLGIIGISANSTFCNLGVVGQAYPITFNSIVGGLTFFNKRYNVGVMGQAQGSPLNFGGIFEANNCITGHRNYGVYASARSYGTTKCEPDFAGFFQGNAYASGGLLLTSDVMFKDSIALINDALSILSRLKPKQFVFKTDSFPYMNLQSGRHYGLIAQQLDTVLPTLVQNVFQPSILDTGGTVLMDTFNFKAVNYNDLIPIAIRGIQELDSLKVGTNATAADSNHLVKWNTTDKTLVNSQVYDNGTRVGIPVVNTDAYVNVTNHAQEITANFESDFDESTEVVKASYSTDGNPNSVAAVYGYSKYVNGSSQDDGVGGKFIGGKGGVWGIGDGDNDIQIGVGGESMNSTSMNVGVLGKAVHYTPSINVGFSSYVDSADIMNVGVAAESGYINSSSDNIGVISSAQGSSSQNIGGVFQALDSVGTRYGIFAEAHSLAMGPLAYAGYFDGDVIATGTVSWTSDAQLKQNVNDLQPKTALEAILRLQPKTYQYRTADFPYLGLSRGNQYGLLAQEVEQVLPDLVSEIKHPEIRNIKGQVTSPSYDYKGLNYVGLIPVLISAVKQQQTKIDSLETVITDRLTQLEERINGCCGTGESNKRDGNEGAEISAHQMSIELSTMQVIVLEQNVPNPFAEQTSISYFIPEDIKQAQIIFSDMLGRTIKTADVQTGYGVITVFASSLSTGQYSYSLLVDGKVVETRKMNKGR